MRIENLRVIAGVRELGNEVVHGTSLAEMTYLGIGGTTDLVRINRHDSIPELLNLLDRHNIQHKFLGGGSNLLVIDGELPFVVLQLAKPEQEVVIEGNIASVDAAADLGHTGNVLRQERPRRHGRPHWRARYSRRGAAYECRCIRHADRLLRPRSEKSIARQNAKSKLSRAIKFHLNTGTLLLRPMI